MPKEMRISATLPIPEDFGERTDLMVRVNPAVQALREALGVAITVADVTVKGPRFAKPEPVSLAPPAPPPNPEPATEVLDAMADRPKPPRQK